MKLLIFDAGPLISLTMNGLLNILEKIKKTFSGEFVITPHVKKEIIENPSKIKKYELEAIKVQKLIDNKILVPSSKFVKNNILEKETIRLSKRLNSSFISSQLIARSSSLSGTVFSSPNKPLTDSILSDVRLFIIMRRAV